MKNGWKYIAITLMLSGPLIVRVVDSHTIEGLKLERDSYKQAENALYEDLKIQTAKCVKDDTVISWLEGDKEKLEQKLTQCRATHNATFDAPVNSVNIGDNHGDLIIGH